MAARGRSSDQQSRLCIAQAAARLMAEDGLLSHQVAKQKAARHLGLSETRNLPSNLEVEAALEEYQRLFLPDSQRRWLIGLRRTALEAMRLLEPFRPRLVGPVLRGTAAEHSPVLLHVFTDTAEDVGLFLLERRIPHELGEHRVRYTAAETVALPRYRFLAGEMTVDLVVFSLKEQRQAPLSPVDGRPMRRAEIREVQDLLAEVPAGAAG